MALVIPDSLKPADGRFGSGPAKLDPEHLERLAATGRSLMGTSHRQPPVRATVGRVLDGLRSFFDLPDGYRIAIGNGGATAFWDLATFALVEQRSQHLSFGEFGAKFAAAADAAPHLEAASVIAADPGGLATAHAEAGVDVYAWPHNETSTGVMAPVRRVEEADDGALVLVDATSGAGGLPVDLAECDCYYFAPQKAFASDGGLWLAILSPAAIERAERIAASGRWIPGFFDLRVALDNARKQQTHNTPAIATLFLMAEQLTWMNRRGGLEAMVERTTASATTLYDWALASDVARPFVVEPEHRSLVVGTIDFDERIDAADLAATLRANGIVDTEPYRKLGRNQLRIGMYPAVDAADVEALTACLDYVVERM